MLPIPRVSSCDLHAGCGVGPDGYTQMSLEDVGVLRSLPNMAILQPADDIETEQMVSFLVKEHTMPSFLRLTRQKVPRVHDSSYKFELGKADVLGMYPIYQARDSEEDQAAVSAEKIVEQVPGSVGCFGWIKDPRPSLPH